MWLFTQDGFVSAVAHREKPGVLLVRARDKKSLEDLAALTRQKIKTTENADYLYRIEVSKLQFAEWLLDSVDEIDYDNYKNRVHETRGSEFAMPLHEVWHAMLQVEDTGNYRRSDDWDSLTYADMH